MFFKWYTKIKVFRSAFKKYDDSNESLFKIFFLTVRIVIKTIIKWVFLNVLEVNFVKSSK